MRFLITARTLANSGAPESREERLSGESAGVINCLQPLDGGRWAAARKAGGRGGSFAGTFLELIELIRPLPHPADWM